MAKTNAQRSDCAIKFVIYSRLCREKQTQSDIAGPIVVGNTVEAENRKSSSMLLEGIDVVDNST